MRDWSSECSVDGIDESEKANGGGELTAERSVAVKDSLRVWRNGASQHPDAGGVAAESVM